MVFRCILIVLIHILPRPHRGKESSATWATGVHEQIHPPLARGRIGQQAPQSASDTQPVELRSSPFSPYHSLFVTLLSVLVEISERVELAGDDARKESRVRWRRRGGPSDGPSSDGPPPPGASANGMVTSRRVRVAGAGIVVTVVVPLVALTSMRALLVTVIRC